MGKAISLRRWLVGLISVLAIAFWGIALLSSLNQPQIQSQLQLYQTNLTLLADQSELQQADPQLRRSIVGGATATEAAVKAYQQALETARKERTVAETKLKEIEKDPRLQEVASTRLPNAARLLKTEQSLALNLGLIQASQGKTAIALDTWAPLLNQSGSASEVANVLTGLWSDPARLLPESEAVLEENLQGWFRFQALSRLYQLQQRSQALNDLRQNFAVATELALGKLVTISLVPLVGGFLGLVLLIGQLIQVWRHRHEPKSPRWSVPWGGETVLQVLLVGFVFLGQIFISQLLLPTLLSLTGIQRSALSPAGQAGLILLLYGVMAVSVLGFMALSLQPWRPLPANWFRLRNPGSGLTWGIGGYLMALPLVVGVSLINQRLWGNEGGSNPLLELALNSQDQTALSLFWLTAAVAAPVFEETLFRGFLMPSLTRWFPAWGAIALSGILFAAAHLSLAELMPLAVLGCVLGYVYLRSQTLLAPMLLHGLWNSGTLATLVILGSSQ
jgi:membrane protease YdiL (CAAX protease family)